MSSSSSDRGERDFKIYKQYNKVAITALYARIEHREQGYPTITGNDPCFERLTAEILMMGLHEITRCLMCERSCHALCCDQEHMINPSLRDNVETYSKCGTTMGYCGYYLPTSAFHKLYEAFKITVLIFEDIHLAALDQPKQLGSICVLCCARILRSQDPSRLLTRFGWTENRRIGHSSLKSYKPVNGKPEALYDLFDVLSV
ncbi:TPA_asm: protein 4 [Taxus virus 1]|uniref:Protein 4 n=1 Tax=Taxus virus 1 TaxID=2977994 RepID=A0A9N6YJQ3_9RHAB|nr:TPA_asm: protein 4 [Taxus virus 1]